VHVAADSLAEPGFVQAIAHLLAGAPDAARRLAIEVSEAAVAHAERLGLAATAWRPLGVRLGLENAGRSLHLLLEAHARGVDYLKVDARFLRGVARDAQLAEYAGQVLAAARGMGLDVYAAGVDAAADLQRLWELGYAGASGPAVGPSR
jgi:EAL domain-containing protein (putative c-di-GMP-specific phosphodiesterase class I)